MHAERSQQLCSDTLMADGVEVESIVGPVPGSAELGIVEEIDEPHTHLLGERRRRNGQRLPAGADGVTERQSAGRVRAGEQQHVDPGFDAAAHRDPGQFDQSVGIDTAPQHVVAAAVERHQRRQGIEGQCRVDLLGRDRRQQPATDRQIRVLDVAMVQGEPVGDQICPPPHPLADQRSAHTFGETVADRDVSNWIRLLPHGLGDGDAAVDRDGLPCHVPGGR